MVPGNEAESGQCSSHLQGMCPGNVKELNEM